MNLKKPMYFILILYGIIFQKIFSRTPRWSYLAFRKYFVLNAPDGFKFFNNLFKILKPINKIVVNDQTGIIRLNDVRVEDICKKIENKGYYIFEEKLDIGLVKSIKNKLENVRVHYGKEKMYLNQTHSLDYPRFDFDNQELIEKCPELIDLIFDKSFYCIAAKYLKSKPYMDLVACWYSRPAKSGQSEAAQEYHYDLDRFKFLKFFVYLTDVDTKNGPHCYIETSNRIKPTVIEDRRYSEKELLETYSNDKFKEIKGSAGTIIAVDTLGYHKGKELTEGDRTIFQIEYANSMFGQNYPKIKLESNVNIEKPFEKVFC